MYPFFVLSLLATSVISQTIPNISPCVLDCIQEAAPGNCDLNDVSCFCKNTNFQLATLQCLQSKCSASDLESATSMQTSMCNGASSGSSSAASSNTASPTATSPASTSSVSSQSSGNGAPTQNMASVFAMALGGAIVGGALTL